MVASVGGMMGGDQAAETGDDLLDRGEREFFVVWEIQLATPGVEELHGGGSSSDLCFQIGNGGLSDAMEECAEDLRLVVEETLDGGESFLGLAFYHVAGKCPRSTGKAQDGNFGTDGFHNTTDGFGKKGRFFLWVENLEAVDIQLRAHRIRQVWAGVPEFHRQTHGFSRRQNGRENDN